MSTLPGGSPTPASLAPPAGRGRRRLERRARRLAWLGNAWHGAEFAIAIAAGLASGSIALIGFGLDSLVEVAAASVIIWLFSGGRGGSQAAERHAQRLIAGSYFALAAYVAVQAGRDLVLGQVAGTSWPGILLAAVTAPTMPLLARAKRRVGRDLKSRATESEAEQNQLCAYLSIALLIGLGSNAAFGWWWADPLAALAIAAAALREGIAGWRGDACCDS